MKFYEGLKGKGKSFKLGVVGAGFCLAGALVSPCYSEVKQEQVVPQTKLEQVDALYQEKTSGSSADLINLSASELKINYETALYNAVKNGRLISPEVENLHNILTKYLEAKDKKYSPQIKNRESVETKVVGLENIVVDSFDLIMAEFKQKILDHYPYLCSIDKNVTLKYDALKTIKDGETFKGLIERLYKLRGEKIPQSMDKESYEIRDMVFFNGLLESSKGKSSKDRIIHPNQVLNPVKKLSLSDEQLKLVNNFYKEYLNARDKEFAKAEKYWHRCTLDFVGSGYLGFTIYFKKEIKENIKTSLVAQGYGDIRLPNFYERADVKGKFPKIPGWAMLLFGIGFPALRTWLTAKYTRREYDGADLGGNLFNAALGSLMLDTWNPLIFPIRVFAAPFVFEPLRKVISIYGKK